MANKCTTRCCYTTLNDVVTCDTVEYNCGDSNPCRGYRGGGRVIGAYRSSTMSSDSDSAPMWPKLVAVAIIAFIIYKVAK